MAPPVVVHVTNTLDWWAIVLDGIASAFVGGVISLFVALFVLRRTKVSDRSLEQERQAKEAAAKLMGVLAECGSGLATHVRSIGEDTAEERRRLVSLVNLAVQTEMPSFADGRYDQMLTATAAAVTDLVTLLYYELPNQPGAAMPNKTSSGDWLLAQSEWGLAAASVRELSDYLSQVSGDLAEFRRNARRQPTAPLPPSYQALNARIARTTPIGWRSEPNGAQAASAMNALQYRGNHPGYARVESTTDPPHFVFAAWTSCLALGADPPTTELQGSFRRFLASPAVRGLVDGLSRRSVGLDWTSFGPGGRVTLEAALGRVDTADLPAATALLAFNGSSWIGADGQHTAVLVVRVEMQEPDGSVSPPFALSRMVSQLTKAEAVTEAFVGYLADDLGLVASDRVGPFAQLGFMVHTMAGLGQVIDLARYESQPATTIFNEWRGYLLQEPNGRTASEAAVDAVRVMCDSGLHILGYEEDLVEDSK